MDWTGGAKRRFANRKNDSVLQRQRAHFAKARATAAALASSTRTKVLSEEHIAAEQMQQIDRSRSRTYNQCVLHDIDQTHGHSLERDFNDFHPEQMREETKASKHVRDSRSASLHDAALSDSRTALLACRKRLQPQNDWLSLAAVRPVQISFKNAQDKGKIGRRRQVERPSGTNNRSYSKRHIQERIESPFDGVGPFMSGALPAPNNVVKIKIGTEAFSSQIQPSHRTHTPVTTHLYHISTPSSRLSEDTMLLDDDVGSFGLQQDTRDIPVATIERDSTGSDRPTVESELSRLRSTLLERNHSLPRRSSKSHREEDGDHEEELGTEKSMETFSEDSLKSTKSSHRAQLDRDELSITGEKCNDVQAAAAQDEHDEEAWRRFMQIKQYPPSKASVMALPSSSQHDTDTTEMICDQTTKAPRDNAVHAKDIGRQGAEAIRSKGKVVPSLTTDQSVHSAMTSKSLSRIRRLCQPQAPEIRSKGSDAADEEIWRRFVIGSQKSERSSPPRAYLPKIVRSSEERFLAEDMSDHDSDRATVATSVFPRNGPSGWNKERAFEIHNDGESSSSFERPTSVVAHASLLSSSVLSAGPSPSRCAVSRKGKQKVPNSVPQSREGRKRRHG